MGARVGVPWLGHACGLCGYCKEGHENLCDYATFTGLSRNGGFAELVLADAAFCLALPDRYDAVHAAPLLCAGLIGHRAYAMAGGARRIGLYGFGAAAHLLLQLANFEGRESYVFVRSGDNHSANFARQLGARWVGDSNQFPPDPLDAALIFAPAGELIPQALRSVRKGGNVICAGIHMSDIPAFPYEILWGERTLRSVANLTRADGKAFLEKAARHPFEVAATVYDLTDANRAMDDLRQGRLQGAAVLVPRKSGQAKPS
jgi:propanol-preferring alcohol dehydrogenase